MSTSTVAADIAKPGPYCGASFNACAKLPWVWG